ncbi:MAG: Na+/H+ antiporter NhaC [Planctomycetota bacterium]
MTHSSLPSPDNDLKNPSFLQSLATFLVIVGVIGFGLFYLKTSIHSLMLVCLSLAGMSAWTLSNDGFQSIRRAMNSGIQRALSAIYIFILIGVLISALIQCGAVATLIYYGLNSISPAVFLPAGMVLCSLMSVVTGTSWGTAGTAGVVLMGIGQAMDIPTPIVAGAVISGACFGDKMSPVSDTTNLAAMSSETDLYRHIRSMLVTTVPAYLLAMLIFCLVGVSYAGEGLADDQLNRMLTGIETAFSVSWITLLPFVVLVVMGLRRISPEVAMMSSAGVAVILAVLFQQADFTSVLESLHSGGRFETGVDTLDNLFSRGGIMAMMWTLSLALLALALGGILSEFGFLKTLISGMLKRIKTSAGLISTTILSGIVGNMSMGEAYMTIILGGQLYSKAFDERGLERSVLSRSLEEGATLSTALIPWTTAGAFFAKTLDVQVIDYLPWALFNWINPILAIGFAYLGIGLFRAKTVAAIRANE